MKVSNFIKLIEDNKNFNIIPKIHLNVLSKELEKRRYKYPKDTYEGFINISSIDIIKKEVLIEILTLTDNDKENKKSIDFIKKLQLYKDFEIKSILYLEAIDEKSQIELYGLYYGEYEVSIELDDIGYSYKNILLGIELINKIKNDINIE